MCVLHIILLILLAPIGIRHPAPSVSVPTPDPEESRLCGHNLRDRDFNRKHSEGIWPWNVNCSGYEGLDDVVLIIQMMPRDMRASAMLLFYLYLVLQWCTENWETAHCYRDSCAVMLSLR